MDKQDTDQSTDETGDVKKEKMPEDEGMKKDESTYHDISEDKTEEDKESST